MAKTLQDFNVRDKKVLVRCDFNVALDEKSNIAEDFRIKEVLPTIKYLIEKGAKVILMSHLGRPEKNQKSKIKNQKFSLEPIAVRLRELLKKEVKFLSDCLGQDVEREIKKMDGGDMVLLENLRFHKEEEENDANFGRELAGLGDIFINEAFGASHRAHASIVGIPKRLPSGIGFLFAKEIRILSRVLNDPWRPLVAIIGGVKIETKIKLIKNLLKKADHVLLGGEIANVILRVKGICLARPLPEEKILKEIEGLNLTNPKLHLPIDAIASPDKTGQSYIRQIAPGKLRKDELILDIGPETIDFFSVIIKQAKMIVMSGPLGLFEEKPFEKGTKEIGQAISRNHAAFKVAGGGDTVFALNKFDLFDKFDYVSTGGGAMLEFLGGEKLPGLEVLKTRP